MVNVSDLNVKEAAARKLYCIFGSHSQCTGLPVSCNNIDSITFPVEPNQCLNRFKTIHYDEHPMQRQTIPQFHHINGMYSCIYRCFETQNVVCTT